MSSDFSCSPTLALQTVFSMDRCSLIDSLTNKSLLFLMVGVVESTPSSSFQYHMDFTAKITVHCDFCCEVHVVLYCDFCCEVHVVLEA